MCLLCGLLGVPCLSSGGAYLIDLMDNFLVGIPLLCFGAMETACLAWVYGFKNICLNVKTMLAVEPGWYIKSTWVFFCPVCLIILSIATLTSFNNEYKFAGILPYPFWATFSFKCACLCLLILAPIWGVLQIFNHDGSSHSSPFVPNKNWKIPNSIDLGTQDSKLCESSHKKENNPDVEEGLSTKL